MQKNEKEKVIPWRTALKNIIDNFFAKNNIPNLERMDFLLDRLGEYAAGQDEEEIRDLMRTLYRFMILSSKK
jgi:hypothetical protein